MTPEAIRHMEGRLALAEAQAKAATGNELDYLVACIDDLRGQIARGKAAIEGRDKQ